jgi:hypothetical protein
VAAALRKVYSDDYRFAGLATRDGEVTFRATTREFYAERLERYHGDEGVKFIELPSEMTKPQAALYLKGHPDYQSPEEQAVLEKASRGATLPSDLGQDAPKSPIKSPSPKLITQLADLAEREWGCRPSSITMTWPVD